MQSVESNHLQSHITGDKGGFSSSSMNLLSGLFHGSEKTPKFEVENHGEVGREKTLKIV